MVESDGFKFEYSDTPMAQFEFTPTTERYHYKWTKGVGRERRKEEVKERGERKRWKEEVGEALISLQAKTGSQSEVTKERKEEQGE